MYYFIGEHTKKKFDTFLYGGSISKSLLRFLQFYCYVKIKCTFSQENIKAANNSAETLATNFTWILPNLLLVVTFFFPHFPPGGGTYFEATLLVSKVVKSQFFQGPKLFLVFSCSQLILDEYHRSRNTFHVKNKLFL